MIALIRSTPMDSFSPTSPIADAGEEMIQNPESPKAGSRKAAMHSKRQSIN
jgi:hypothetical protein